MESLEKEKFYLEKPSLKRKECIKEFLEDNFNKACKEMYICFKNIDNTMYEKIPNELLKVIIGNMDSDYYLYYDESKKSMSKNYQKKQRI